MEELEHSHKQCWSLQSVSLYDGSGQRQGGDEMLVGLARLRKYAGRTLATRKRAVLKNCFEYANARRKTFAPPSDVPYLPVGGVVPS